MPVLPVPMIIALLLFAILAWRMLTRETHITLLALFAACAIQSAIIALVQYYGVTTMRPVQPLLATLIAPIAWLAFTQAADSTEKQSHLWVHGIGFALATLFLFLQPMLLDVLIPVSFAGYGAAMLLRLGRGEDSLPNSPLEGGAMPLLAWRIIAISLLASAACDVMMAYSLAIGENGILRVIPSVVSSLSLLSLGALSLSHTIESRRDDGAGESILSAEDATRDQAIIGQLDEYVSVQRPFLDPDLTLSRLSRRLVIPAKQLSTAINRVKGENVSRFINRHRIDHACAMMAAGKSVTDSMLSSGFNTKSNFNREFLRVKGKSPVKWLEGQAALLNNAAEAPISVMD